MEQNDKEKAKMDQYIGPKSHYSCEKELSDFYTKMNQENKRNHSRVVWEWLRNAPCLDDFALNRFHLWKENGEVVSVARPISPWPGEAVIDNKGSSVETINEMIQYVEENLSVQQEDTKSIFLVLLDQEDKLDQQLQENGYEKLTLDLGTLHFDLSKEIPSSMIDETFEIRTLFEVFDFDQLSQVCWLGFGYEGEIPKIDDKIQSSIKHAWLNYNREICSVVLDPNGDYASFCGFWYDETTQTAYLEPMVTVPKYRNQGLGKAAFFHSLKLLQGKGCKGVFVDPDEEPYPYYLKIGFEPFEYARYYQKTF